MTEAVIRQAQVLRSRGLSYAAIGDRIGVNASTVRKTLDPKAAAKVREYNESRRMPSIVVGKRREKTGHQFPWEGDQ